MKIKLKEITVRDLTAGYMDDGEAGVVGFGGLLDIRPPLSAGVYLQRCPARCGYKYCYKIIPTECYVLGCRR